MGGNTILRDLSVLWSLFHALIMLMFFFTSRFSRKKTTILTVCFMGPLLVLNFILFMRLGPAGYPRFMPVTCSVPSGIFFLYLAKNKGGGRFFFSFCFSVTIAMEIIVITNILDWLSPWDNYIVMFLTRLVAYPLAEFVAFHYLRRDYEALQRTLPRGWWGFSAITSLFYLSLILETTVPTVVTERPEYLPQVILILILMPCSYTCIFTCLRQQYMKAEAERTSTVLELQTSMMAERVADMDSRDEDLRLLRHDMRHTLGILSQMLECGKYDEALEYIRGTSDAVSREPQETYCSDPVLNATFSYYFRKARAAKIPVEHNIKLALPENVETAELSTVFANALDNAINACQALPEDKRYIKCRCISYPKLMFAITNPYSGQIKLDCEGLPVTDKPGHGLGVRSIAACCRKHGALCEYKLTPETLTLRIALP